MRERRLTFRLHFNRINMQRGNPNVWTVHNSHGCYQVQEVECYVTLRTVFKKDGRQPRAYLTGKGHVSIHENPTGYYTAVIS